MKHYLCPTFFILLPLFLQLVHSFHPPGSNDNDNNNAYDTISIRNVYRHPPSILESCPPNSSPLVSSTVYTKEPSSSPTLVQAIVHNEEKTTSMLLSWIDYYGVEHPRYIIPAQCTRSIVASYGSSWRAWPLPMDRFPIVDKCTSPTGFGHTVSHATFIINPSKNDTEASPGKFVGEFTIAESTSVPCENLASHLQRTWNRKSSDSSNSIPLFPWRINLLVTNFTNFTDPSLLSSLPNKYSPYIRRLYRDYFQQIETFRDIKPDYLQNPPMELRLDYKYSKTTRKALKQKDIDSVQGSPDHEYDHISNTNDDDMVKEVLHDLKNMYRASGFSFSANNDDESKNIPKASLYLQYKNVNYIKRPVDKHPGLRMTIKQTIIDILNPHSAQAIFYREEECPYCNYKDTTPPSAGSTVIPKGIDGIPEKIDTEIIDPHSRYPLQSCPYCKGNGIAHAPVDHVPSLSSSSFVKGVSVYSFGEQSIRSICPFCQGLGTILQHSHNFSCIHCQNRRYVDKMRGIEFILPAGIPNNYQKELPDEGGIKLGKQYGSFMVRLPSDTFNEPLHHFYQCSLPIYNNQSKYLSNYDDNSSNYTMANNALTEIPLRVSNLTRIGFSEIFSENDKETSLGNAFTHGLALSKISFNGTMEKLLEDKHQNNDESTSGKTSSLSRYSRLQNSSLTSSQIFEFLPVSRTLQPDDSGPHLRMDLKLSINEAIHGINYAIITPRGIIRLDHIRPPIFPGDVFVIPGGGLPVFLPSFCVWNHSCNVTSGSSSALSCPDAKDGTISSSKYPSVPTLVEECQLRSTCNVTFLHEWQILYNRYRTMCTKSSTFPSIDEITDKWNETIVGNPFSRNETANETSMGTSSDFLHETAETVNPSYQNVSYPLSRTIILCSPINETIVHAYPHGHLFINLDVDLRSSLPYFLSNSPSSSLSPSDIVQKMFMQSRYRKAEPSSKYSQQKKRRILREISPEVLVNTSSKEFLLDVEPVKPIVETEKPWKKRSP